MTVNNKIVLAISSLFSGLLALVLISGCSQIASDPTPSPTAPKQTTGQTPPAAQATTQSDGETGAGEAVNAALESATGASGSWDSLRIQVECTDDGVAYTLDVYGNGVGIWNRKTQFQASRDQLIGALDAMLQADFASMRETYGGKGDPESVLVPVERRPVDGNAALRVVCWISLDLDGVSKRSGQLDQGHQYQPLEDLAHRVLDQFRAAAEDGVGADGLADGLRKIADGELAPEAMRVMLQRRAEPREREAPGFQLRLFGGEVTTRPYTRADGYGPTLVIEIDERELADLTTSIARSGVESFPNNLYSEMYTDFEIEVLQYKKALQARQFSGMEKTTHGDAQVGFDAILERLLDLHERVLREGREAPNQPAS